MECDQSEAHRYAVPKSTDNRASERTTLPYVDLAGPMELESAGGNRYVVMIVDDFSPFSVIKFLKTKPFGQNCGCTRELCRDIYHPGTAQYPRCEFTCRITRIAEGYETVHWSTGVDQVFLRRGFSFIFPC